MRRYFYMDANELPYVKPSFAKAKSFAEKMKSGDKFKPVQVWKDKGGRYTFDDGITRVAAAKISGIKLFVYENIKDNK